MHMKNRQGMNQHIVIAPVPIVFQYQCIAQQIAMTQHRPFAAAGGAAGVNDGGQIVWL